MDYSRQTRFAGIGPEGQDRLGRASVVIVGVGALGSAIAEQACRAGVGRIRLIDRDVVEASNLQRQTLYTLADAEEARPKALAAAERLAALTDAVVIEPRVTEVTAANVSDLIAGADLVWDGGDTFALRHLVNEACCRAGIPWIYAACVGAYACCLPIIPGHTPCLRCLQDELPAAGDGPTCDTAGIVAPAVHQAAAWAVAEGMKLLLGREVRAELWASDLWERRFQKLDVSAARSPECPACGTAPTYPALQERSEPAVVLCGRDAIQVRLGRPLDLARAAERIGGNVDIANAHVLRWHDGATRATAFADGRVLVHGLSVPERARGFVDRWLG